MQCIALNIKTAVKQVWLYFIRRTTWPGYGGGGGGGGGGGTPDFHRRG